MSIGSGLLTADANKKIICVLPNDPLVKSTALMGVWIDLTDEMYEPDRLISYESPLTRALAEYADLLSRSSTDRLTNTLCLVFHRDPLCPSIIVRIPNPQLLLFQRHSFFEAHSPSTASFHQVDTSSTLSIANLGGSMDERIVTLLERQQSEISKLQRQMAQLCVAVRMKNRRLQKSSSSSESSWTSSDAETVRASVMLNPARARSPQLSRRRLIERGTNVQRQSLANHSVLTAVKTDDERSEAAESSDESSDDEFTRRILRKYLGQSGAK